MIIVYTVGELLRQWRHRRLLSLLDLAIAADDASRSLWIADSFNLGNPSGGITTIELAKRPAVDSASRALIGLASGELQDLSNPDPNLKINDAEVYRLRPGGEHQGEKPWLALHGCFKAFCEDFPYHFRRSNTAF